MGCCWSNGHDLLRNHKGGRTFDGQQSNPKWNLASCTRCLWKLNNNKIVVTVGRVCAESSDSARRGGSQRGRRKPGFMYRPPGVVGSPGRGGQYSVFGSAVEDAAREQDQARRAEELGEDVVSSSREGAHPNLRACPSGCRAQLHLGELHLLLGAQWMKPHFHPQPSFSAPAGKSTCWFVSNFS